MSTRLEGEWLPDCECESEKFSVIYGVGPVCPDCFRPYRFEPAVEKQHRGFALPEGVVPEPEPEPATASTKNLAYQKDGDPDRQGRGVEFRPEPSREAVQLLIARETLGKINRKARRLLEYYNELNPYRLGGEGLTTLMDIVALSTNDPGDEG